MLAKWEDTVAAGGALCPGHHAVEEGDIGLAPPPPYGARDLLAGAEREGAHSRCLHQPDIHPRGHPRGYWRLVFRGRGAPPPPPPTLRRGTA